MSDFFEEDQYNIPDFDYYYSWDYERGCAHKWVWYLGFHIEQFWYCDKCGEKDIKRPPPSP
jgi:hypothetical protein